MARKLTGIEKQILRLELHKKGGKGSQKRQERLERLRRQQNSQALGGTHQLPSSPAPGNALLAGLSLYAINPYDGSQLYDNSSSMPSARLGQTIDFRRALQSLDLQHPLRLSIDDCLIPLSGNRGIGIATEIAGLLNGSGKDIDYESLARLLHRTHVIEKGRYSLGMFGRFADIIEDSRIDITKSASRLFESWLPPILIVYGKSEYSFFESSKVHANIYARSEEAFINFIGRLRSTYDINMACSRPQDTFSEGRIDNFPRLPVYSAKMYNYDFDRLRETRGQYGFNVLFYDVSKTRASRYADSLSIMQIRTPEIAEKIREVFR